MNTLSFSVGIYPTAPVAEVIRLTRLAEDMVLMSPTPERLLRTFASRVMQRL